MIEPQPGLPSGNGNNIEWHFIRCSIELDSALDENQSRLTVGQMIEPQTGLPSSNSKFIILYCIATGWFFEWFYV